MKPPTEPKGEALSPNRHPSLPSIPPIERAGRNAPHSPPAGRAVSNIIHSTMHTHLLPPSPSTFPLSTSTSLLTFIFHFLCSSGVKSTLATMLRTFLQLFRRYLGYNVTEMLIISFPTATPLALQANHKSMTGYVYFFYFIDAAALGY